MTDPIRAARLRDVLDAVNHPHAPVGESITILGGVLCWLARTIGMSRGALLEAIGATWDDIDDASVRKARGRARA